MISLTISLGGVPVTIGRRTARRPTVALTSGAGDIGSTFTATTVDGSISGQWLADGTAIAGATGLAYTIDAAHAGAALAFRQGDGQVSTPVATSAPGVPLLDMSRPSNSQFVLAGWI